MDVKFVKDVERNGNYGWRCLMENFELNKSEKYKIVFCGEIKSDQDLYTAKVRLSSLLNVPLVFVEDLFDGKPILLKTDLSQNEAQSFKYEIEETGIICHLLRVSESTKNLQVNDEHVKHVPSKHVSSKRVPYFRPSSITSDKEGKAKKILKFSIGVILIAIVLSSIPQESNVIRHARPSLKKPKFVKGSLSDKIKKFDEPYGYYKISLPSGYRVINKSSGSRSKIIFSYSDNISVAIMAIPVSNIWNVKTKMDQKVRDFKQGKAGRLARFDLVRYGLTDFNGMEGYEMVFRQGGSLMQVFSFISSRNIEFSISIVVLNKHGEKDYNALKSAVKESLNTN